MLHWFKALDFYDARSSAAHGNPSDVEADEAERAEYWAVNRLLEPILEWFDGHPTDPIGDLERIIVASRQPLDWAKMRGILEGGPPLPDPPVRGRGQATA
jgi:hypothetical protein